MSRPRQHARTSRSETVILDAADRLLRDLPFHAISVEQILKESGISRGNFYFYFSSKFDVLAALLWRVYDELFASMAPWFDDDGSNPVAAVRTSFAAAAAAWQRHGRVAGALLENVGASRELTHLWDDLVLQAVDAVAAKIDAERARGTAPVGTDSRVLAAVISRAVQRVLYLGWQGTSPELTTVDVAADAASALWIAAVYGRVEVAAP